MTSGTQQTTIQDKASEYGIFIRKYSINSNKPLVVFIHGIDVSGEYFYPLTEQLSSLYSVLSIDLPGYGDSNKPKVAYSPKELGDILGSFVLEVGILGSILI